MKRRRVGVGGRRTGGPFMRTLGAWRTDVAIICRDLRLLFIQAPRTGCTAVEALLVERFDGERLPKQHLLDADGRVEVPAKHSTLRQLVRAGLVPADHADSLVTFVTVRNPFDSLLSLYLKQRGSYQARLDKPASFMNRRPRYREDMEFSLDHTFEQWIERRCVPASGEPRGRSQIHGRFVADVQIVLRYERLDEGLGEVLRSVGVTEEVHLPTVNRTEGRERDYREQYSPRARALVEESYRAELDRFGYTFDGPVQVAAG